MLLKAQSSWWVVLPTPYGQFCPCRPRPGDPIIDQRTDIPGARRMRRPMTNRRGRRKRAVAGMFGVVSAAAVSVSACGVPFAGDSSSGRPQSSHRIDVCQLVPSSRVAAVTGRKVTRAAPARADESPAPEAFVCTYFLSTGNAVAILVEPTNSKAVFAASERALNAGGAFPVTRVTGVGDKAGASAIGLAVLAGSYNVVITADRPGQFAGDPAGLTDLARNLVFALGSGPIEGAGS